MRTWGGLPTTGPAAPPSSPGRHRAARAPARRGDPAATSRSGAGRRRHRPPAGGPAGPAAPRAGRPAAAGAGRGRGALRADAGYLARQLARAAPGEHIAFAVGARRSARKGRLPDGAAGDDWREGDRHRRRPGRRGGSPARLAPGGCVAADRPGRAALLTGCCGEPTVALGKTGRAGAADRDV